MPKFSLDNYEVVFELVLQSPIAKQHFYEYLLSSRAEEALNFLNAEQEFLDELDIQKQHERARKIVEHFVLVGSPQEVNVNNSNREQVVQMLETLADSTLLPRHLFEPVSRIIYRELKEDSFPRYIREESFRKFLLEKGETFTSNISLDLRVVGIRNAVLFQPKDFCSANITDRDIYFVLKVNEDTSDWQVVHSEPDRQAYVSKTIYSIGGMNSLQLGKITGVLPYGLQECFTKLELDPQVRKTYDNLNRESMGHKVISAGDNNNFPYSFDTIRYTISIGQLLQRRVFDVMRLFGQDTERQCYFNIGKTSNVYKHQLPECEKKHHVRANMIYGYTYYKISDNKTRYVHIFYNDMKLPLPERMFRSIVVDRSKVHHEGFLKALRANKEPTLATEEQVFREFNERYIPNQDSVKTWSSPL